MDTSLFSRFFERAASTKKLSGEELIALSKAKCVNIVPEEGFEKLIARPKKLRVKFGIDPTGSEVHLGHALPLMLVRLFQRAGHEVHIIIGDFTATIGDPSGRSDARKELSSQEIVRNMKTYTKQIAPLINVKKTKIHKNSSWLKSMKLADFLRVTGTMSFGDVSQREDFRTRITSSVGVSLKEVNYSSLMAIDSLHVKADVEVGGIDQLLNFMQTRDCMSAFGVPAETILTTPILEGTAGDGRKMSKSFNNYIAVRELPENQFGLVMSIPDTLIQSYTNGFADVRIDEQSELAKYIASSPLEAKKQLGMIIVALFHGARAAQRARSEFERKFAKRAYVHEDEKRVSIGKFPVTIFDALGEAYGASRSKTQLRTLIAQKAVRTIGIRGEAIIFTDAHDLVQEGDVIKVGKRDLFRFVK